MDALLEPVTGTEKQQFCVEMLKRLDIQRRNEHFCDVTLEVGSGDDLARLKAHKIVLSAASPFFYNALNSEMKEKKEGVIRLEETSRAVMEEVLEYLYTGHVNISEQNAYELFAQADYFLISSLKVLSGEVILQSLSLYNCVMTHNFAVKYQWEELQRGARDFIHSNFVAVAETEDFLNLSSKQVEEWISSDEIIVEGEEEVFEVLMKWMKRSESRKQSISELFRHIRFIYIARDFLLNVILPNPLINGDLACTNLALDAMKMVFSGKDDCYFAQQPRNCLKTYEDAFVACGRGKGLLCYIPSVNKWYNFVNRLSQRSYFYCHSMTPCHGKLYFIGGERGSYPAERYDPSTNTWTPLKSFNQRISLAAAVTFQGLLYVIGGEDESDEQVSTVQRYNPDTNLWQEVAPLSIARRGVCAVADRNSLYAIGGHGTSGNLEIVERFDPTEKTWTKIASTSEKRGFASGTAVNQKVFVFGGLNVRGRIPDSKFCEIYDPATNIWSSISNIAAPAGGLISVVSFKGKIFASGGFGQERSQRVVLREYDADALSRNCESFRDISLPPTENKAKVISILRIPREVLETCEEVS